MAATPLQFIKAGTTYFNVEQISQIVTQGDGTAYMYYTGGGNRIHLNLGVNEAAAIAALNILLTPTDVTSLIIA
jgi:hypothetical protein